MGFLIFLAAIVWLVLWYFIAKEFENIAEIKGFYGKKYFWWTFFLGPIGMLMVVALPSKAKTTQQVPEETAVIEDDLPEI